MRAAAGERSRLCCALLCAARRRTRGCSEVGVFVPVAAHHSGAAHRHSPFSHFFTSHFSFSFSNPYFHSSPSRLSLSFFFFRHAVLRRHPEAPVGPNGTECRKARRLELSDRSSEKEDEEEIE